MKRVLLEMLSARSGQVSSKRVMGVMVITAITLTYIYCAVTQHPMPDGTGELLIAGTTLLGVDSVTGVFKHDEREKQAENQQ